MNRNSDMATTGQQPCRLSLNHRLLSSSFLGLPYRILYMNHKTELLRSLWVRIITLEELVVRNLCALRSPYLAVNPTCDPKPCKIVGYDPLIIESITLKTVGFGFHR